ncbi:MAG: hypothetical protein M1608_14560 [Candidatus Omnitrophica bacterium]|nr:hypothetical protein [Candidatus Omnitrophota bacterium]
MFNNVTPESINHTTKYVVIRNNFIQLVGGEQNPSAVNPGILTTGRSDNPTGTDFFTVENNVISLAAANQAIVYEYIAHYNCWGNKNKGLLNDLNAIGLDKFHVVYPFIGGTAAAHTLNLMGADHAITWAGSALVHDEYGVTGNRSGYGDTGLALNEIPGASIT